MIEFESIYQLTGADPKMEKNKYLAHGLFYLIYIGSLKRR